MQIQSNNDSARRSDYFGGVNRRSPQQQPYQLHQMIVQSRSTDSQIDVESSYPNMMKVKECNKGNIGDAVPSFFYRTNPPSSILNDSSESSSSSMHSKENFDCRRSTSTTKASQVTKTNLRRPRSQDIFGSTPPTTRSCDDSEDDDDEVSDCKRTRLWDTSVYEEPHNNGLWIQRSYSFEESESDDEDDYDTVVGICDGDDAIHDFITVPL